MKDWFSFVFPWLLVVWPLLNFAMRFKPLRSGGEDSRRSRVWVIIAFSIISLALVLLPFRGIPLGGWLAGLFQPSMPLLGLLAVPVWRNMADLAAVSPSPPRREERAGVRRHLVSQFKSLTPTLSP